MNFTIDDEEIITNVFQKRITDTIQKLPDGKIVTTLKLSELSGLTKDYIVNHYRQSNLEEFYTKYHNKIVWGNANSIKEFRAIYER